MTRSFQLHVKNHELTPKLLLIVERHMSRKTPFNAISVANDKSLDNDLQKSNLIESVKKIEIIGDIVDEFIHRSSG